MKTECRRTCNRKTGWQGQLCESTELIRMPSIDDKLGGQINQGCCNDGDGHDDLNKLKILHMMLTPAYIMACYIQNLEDSKILHHDTDQGYICSCHVVADKDDFHHCPAHPKFIPDISCRYHIECSDPIDCCFALAQLSSDFAKQVPEYKEECSDIAQQAMDLSVSLLNQCYNTNEVELLLSDKTGLNKFMREVNRPQASRIKHARLISAIELNHKEFVSHMYCQQILRRQWHGGVTWQGKSRFYKVSNLECSSK